MALSRRGWILLSSYRRMCQTVDNLIQEKCKLEKTSCKLEKVTADLQGKIAILECQNLILGDQV